MKRQLLIFGVFLMLTGGWFSAFMVTGNLGRTSIYLLGPTLLLGIGMGLSLKLTQIRLTALSLAISAFLALLILNQFYPQHTPRLSALQGASPQTHQIPVKIPASGQLSDVMVERQLESSARLEIQLYAKLPGVARYLLVTDDGRLFASLSDLGVIYLLVDTENEGYVERPILFHSGLDRPFGMVMRDQRLVVAEPSRLLELTTTAAGDHAEQELVVLDNLPDDGGHWMRSLVADRQGQLYLSIGSRCNACEEEDPRRGTILKIDPDKGVVSEFARGLRNSVGLAQSPDKDILWGADISRDLQGRNPPPDEINRISAGEDYGWPYCFGAQVPDPQLGSVQRCAETLPAVIDLPPLCHPLSIAFGADLNASGIYQDSLYVLCSGSGHRLTIPGPKIVRTNYQQGEITGAPVDFLRGWQGADDSWGAPVAIAVAKDGFMYLSDEKTRAIYRIRWIEEER